MDKFYGYHTCTANITNTDKETPITHELIAEYLHSTDKYQHATDIYQYILKIEIPWTPSAKKNITLKITLLYSHQTTKKK